jgi:hypothetical protein
MGGECEESGKRVGREWEENGDYVTVARTDLET